MALCASSPLLGLPPSLPAVGFEAGLKPEEEEAAMAALDRRLHSILESVRLVYLLDRQGGWDATAKWEDMLSLGEQQRLGMVSKRER